MNKMQMEDFFLFLLFLFIFAWISFDLLMIFSINADAGFQLCFSSNNYGAIVL